MIPQRLVDFVQGSTLAWIGTRDDKLRPSVSFACGTRVSAAKDLMAAFVPDIEADQVKSDLVANGMAAYTVVDGISHEAYQFKGRLVEIRPTTGEERAVQDIHVGKLISYYKRFPETFFGGFVVYPSSAIVFRVEQAFVQTPGPGAGERLDLSAEMA